MGILGTPDIRIIRPTYEYHWSATDNVFGLATAVGMSAERLDQDYRYKPDFEIWRENQDFGRQNISTSRTPLDSTPIGTNTTNGTMSNLDSIPIGTKTPEPMPRTRLTELSKRKGKEHVTAYLKPDPSLSDSPSSESDSSDDRKCKKYRGKNESDLADDIKYRKSKIKKHDKRKSVKNTQNSTHQTCC